MSWWGVFVLAVIAVPVVLVIYLSVADARHNRRIRASPSRSVDGIRERVEREHAEQAASASTEVLPVIEPIPDDEPTVRLRPALLPKRSRRYVQRPPHPYPRRPLPQPPTDLMARVLRGLRDLPDDSPPAPWPDSDPDTKSPPA